MKPLLIGLGSPFGADRLGWLAAERLVPHLPHSDTLTLDRPGPVLLQHLRDRRRVCLIDAARGDAPAGHLYRLTPHDLPHGPPLTSSHALGLAETLRLGAALDALPPHLLVLAVEIGQAAEPEAPLARAWPQLLAQARAHLLP